MAFFVSFRSMIEGWVPRFTRLFPEIHNIDSVLTEMILGVSSYREEGTRHVPMVFLTTSLPVIFKKLKGNDLIQIGEGTVAPLTVRSALKSCGPLTQNQEWAIYILIENSKINYGIFRTDLFPLHESSFQRLRLLRDDGTPIVGVQRVGETIVEVRSASGNFFYLDSSGQIEATQNPSLLIHQFVRAVTRDVEHRLKKRIEAFYDRIAVELFTSNHGSLAAIVEYGNPLPEYFKDGIILNERLGLTPAVNRHVKYRDEGSTLCLAAHGSLIQKMLEMDGVTVFDTMGSVLAYNCFVRDLSQASDHGIRLGGARKRAYEILKSKLGIDLIAALYKSQDGHGECEVARTKRDSSLLS